MAPGDWPQEIVPRAWTLICLFRVWLGFFRKTESAVKLRAEI
jgi:hypothetical protein